MQKTEVLKLNTSKDNVQTFFNKVKDKIGKQGTKGDDYDITMIVKHKNTQPTTIMKQNPVYYENPKTQTLKSIFTQGSPHTIQNIPQEHIKNNQIYDQEMRLQRNVLRGEKGVQRKSSKEIQKKMSGTLGKISQQKEIGNQNDGAFQFRKKKTSEQSPRVNKNNYFPKLQKPKLPTQDHVAQMAIQQQVSNNKSHKSSSQQSSYKQQKNQQQLKKHISHQHVDIFPNIELSSVVSQRLMSFNNSVQGQQQRGKKKNKNNTLGNMNRRRCSIADENLLSPRMKTMVSEEIKHESTKEINNMLRDKLMSKSSVSVEDVKEENEMGKQIKSDISIKAIQDEPVIRLQMLQRPQMVKQNMKNRPSGFAKKSIFEVENNQQGNEQKEQCNSNNNQMNVQQQHQTQQQQQFVITSPKQPRHMSIPAGKKNLATHFQNQHQQQQSLQQQSSSQQQSSQSSSNQQQQQQPIHAIETKLNQCITLIQKNEIFKLQDQLYEFKNKYNYVTNTRIEIKWRLVMAYCKESKKEFQRAAVNYTSVIQLASDNPKSLTIEPAQVYHRLGVCYCEIKQYNKGILAFTQALNRYKRAKAPLKYAQCMNNLGNLYLQAQSINLAQKCFLQSYDLKKTLYDKHNTKLLTPLFNLFECNLLMKNYDQAQRIMFVVEDEIISRIPQKQTNKLLYLGGMYRRKGKMEFLRGNIDNAQQNYLKAFQSMSNKYPYCMQFGELMSCMGILKLQDKKYKQAKEYYDKAIMLMNFYCPKDSKTIHTLKKNLEYAIRMIAEEKQGSNNKQSFFD